MIPEQVDLKTVIIPVFICVLGLAIGFLSLGMGPASFLLIIIPAVMALVFYRFIYGVYLLIFTLPYLSVFVYEWFGVNLKISDFVALICILVFLTKFALRSEKIFSFSPVMIPLGIFMLITIIIFFIHYPQVAGLSGVDGLNSPALRSIKVVFWMIFSVLTSVVVCSAIKTEEELQNCVKILLITTVIVCVYSLVGLAGYLLHIKALTWKLVSSPGGFVRLRGTFGEPSYFAHYMAVVLPIALTVFILRIYRLGFVGPTIWMFILFVTQILIFSTTGLVGMLIMVILVLFFMRHYGLLTFRERFRYTMVFIAAAVAFLFFWAAFNPDLLKVSTGTLAKLLVPETRFSGILLGVRMFCDNFLTGVGPGNWDWFSRPYVPEITALTGLVPSFNNLYFEILLDVGIIGFIPFAFIFIVLFKHLSKAIRITDDKFLQAVLVGFLVGFIVLLLEYMASFNFYRIYTWVPLGIAMAAIRLAHEKKIRIR